VDESVVGQAPVGLGHAVEAMMRRDRVPGLSMAVVDPDRLLFAAGWGTADLGTGKAATPATAFLWFSMTKIVTATAVCRLADEGRLDLDAPAVEYVDCLRVLGTRQPTVRQLLQHTSGLANPLPLRWVHLADTDPPDPEALLRRLISRRRAYRHPVGTAARYSNVGYLAAGQVVSAVAGEPFTTYVDGAVLKPAGMNRTAFSYRADADIATGYVRAPRVVDPVLRRALPQGIAGIRCDGYVALNRFQVNGPAYGGLIGDVLDAARFLRVHLNDGEIDGHRILASRTARAMRVLDRRGKAFDHGIGWFRKRTVTGDWVEHYGSGAGFWNVMRLYPKRRLGVVVMANSTATYDFQPVFALLAGEPG
jgi:CubicO group peptidase (beta-lactamase class C family)